jgi:hypothetical protein
LHRVAKEQSCFLVEGTHAVSEAIACGWPVETIVCTEAWFGGHHQLLVENVGACYLVPESWLAQGVTTEHPDGVAGIVGVDASIRGLGAVLLNAWTDPVTGQYHERVLDCCLHAFTETEAKWKTIEQEAFAMVYALKHWYPLLYGHTFILEGDHKM